MPTVFSVKAGKLPAIQKFIADLCYRTGFELVVCSNLLDEDESITVTQWQSDIHYIFYLPFESSRGIDVCLSGGKVFIKLMSLSSHGDFSLAREMLKEFLRYATGGVNSDDGQSAKSADKIDASYDLDWFAEFTISGVESLFSAIENDDDGYVGLVGPSRYFYFGNRMAKSLLRQSEDELDIAELLFPMMQKTQYLTHYPEFEDYLECAQYELELPRLKGKTFAFLSADEGSIVPMTDFLGFEGKSKGEFALLPARKFRTVLAKAMDSDKISW
ncbi:MAG: hypothetical protein K2X81_19805, partial [Candidatus Obscuribacterales bacterium]|nr:hypothetical protein [Candidatus Obscuribacterales bacterium]